jgi:hypothetical protein
MPFNVTTRSVRDIDNDDTICIPEHQRPYVWDGRRAALFIETILSGLPTHALFLYQEVNDGKLKKWLEDGQQRWLTVRGYMHPEDEKNKDIVKSWAKWDDYTKFEDLSAENKEKIKSYMFTIYTIEKIDFVERMMLFQRLQDGKPLTNGQRFNACSNMSIVRLAKRILNDARCRIIWALPSNLTDKGGDTKGFTYLTNAMAIASGIAVKNVSYIVTSYNLLGPHINIKYDDADANQRLDKLIDVYQRADKAYPVGKATVKKQWAVGTYTGYILFNLLQSDIDWEKDSQMWVDYIVRCRKDKAAYNILQSSKPKSRNWTSDRWSLGLEYVRDPSLADDVSDATEEDQDEDD